jgi:hypothetical protein
MAAMANTISSAQPTALCLSITKSSDWDAVAATEFAGCANRHRLLSVTQCPAAFWIDCGRDEKKYKHPGHRTTGKPLNITTEGMFIADSQG